MEIFRPGTRVLIELSNKNFEEGMVVKHTETVMSLTNLKNFFDVGGAQAEGQISDYHPLEFKSITAIGDNIDESKLRENEKYKNYFKFNYQVYEYNRKKINNALYVSSINEDFINYIDELKKISILAIDIKANHDKQLFDLVISTAFRTYVFDLRYFLEFPTDLKTIFECDRTMKVCYDFDVLDSILFGTWNLKLQFVNDLKLMFGCDGNIKDALFKYLNLPLGLSSECCDSLIARKLLPVHATFLYQMYRTLLDNVKVLQREVYQKIIETDDECDSGNDDREN